MKINPSNENIIPTLEFDINATRYKNYRNTHNLDDY